MSRGVKDLRDLICISRLTFRDSDSDGYASDDSLKGSLGDAADRPGGPSASASPERRRSGAPASATESDNTSGPSSASSADHLQSAENGRAKKKRKKKKKQQHSDRELLRGRPSPASELPRLPVLPQVNRSRPSSSSMAPAAGAAAGAATSVAPVVQGALGGAELERLLTDVDTTVVSGWLERANRAVAQLADWCSSAERFVAFAHFWLSDFPATSRHEMLKLEFDIALDELRLAFALGLRSGSVTTADVGRLLSAVYREYPRRLCSSAASSSGAHLFLDYLDTFTSERAAEYRHVLTDVKLSTANRQHAHYLLAARSFVLISAWHAAVAFYRKLHADGEDVAKAAATAPSARGGSSISDLERNCERVQEAIQRGYVDVCQYYFRSGKVSASSVDRHGRTFFFVAVTSRQLQCVDYLLRKWPGCTDANRPCDTGNAPIHVAVNLGDEALVKRLLLVPDLDVNAKNVQCDGATALHLAAMHGHSGIVKLLLMSGKVDLTCRMGNLTALDFAKDLDQSDVVKIIEDFVAATPDNSGHV